MAHLTPVADNMSSLGTYPPCSWAGANSKLLQDRIEFIYIPYILYKAKNVAHVIIQIQYLIPNTYLL
jgi:hypothetical protein